MTERSDLVLRVGDIELRPIVTVGADATLQAAASVMQAHSISSVIVSRPGEPVAILTERDVTRAVAADRAPDTPVAGLASPRPLTVDADAAVIDAAGLMLTENVRHLVVTRDGRAVGVVSIRDLLTALVDAVAPERLYVMLQAISGSSAGSWPG